MNDTLAAGARDAKLAEQPSVYNAVRTEHNSRLYQESHTG